jgi:hypothetical protein
MEPRRLEELAYEASLRAPEKQERVLDELRARTGMLLAASSLAASFLGGRTIDGGRPAIVVAALVAFAVSVLGCVFVLVPRPYAFTFALDGASVFEEFYDLRHNPHEVLRRLAYNLRAFWDANDTRIQPLFLAFRLASVALVAEIVLFLLSVGGTLG